MDTFTQAYIDAALWSSTAYGSPEERREDPNQEGKFDRSFQSCGYDKLTRMAEIDMKRDCKAFQADNAALLEYWYTKAGETPERAGHDFWLTRNGHGAGFWDRWSSGTPQGLIGAKLTESAKSYGSCDLYYTRGKVAIQ